MDPAAADDLDGAVNRAEWIAGTDPRNADSKLALEIYPTGDGGFEIAWPSASGRKDLLYSSTDLRRWRLVPPSETALSGPAPLIRIEIQPAAGGTFFRLESGRE